MKIYKSIKYALNDSYEGILMFSGTDILGGSTKSFEITFDDDDILEESIMESNTSYKFTRNKPYENFK